MPFSSASVTTSSAIIIPARPERSVYFIANPPTSGQTIYIQENGAAIVGAGSLAIAPGNDFVGRGGAAVHAIAGGSTNVTVTEY
ncbi:MAG: hypothetical protein LCH38_15240 [Proteobacteria bacterium]|nr:hypothetical protein [Pseudomonadota bacterium]